MATRQRTTMSFWQRLNRGPWPEQVADRLRMALVSLAGAVAETSGAVGLVLFGSYARGEFGRKSDVDLLLLLTDHSLRRQFISLAGELESRHQLPMHLAPIFADPNHPETLGPTLLHDLWTDGVILYGIAADLGLLRPGELAPWEVIRFTAKHLPPAKRVDLSRRLYGRGDRLGLVVPPAVSLGPGVILLPPIDARKVKDALDEFGAVYDTFPIWRST